MHLYLQGERVMYGSLGLFVNVYVIQTYENKKQLNMNPRVSPAESGRI